MYAIVILYCFTIEKHTGMLLSKLVHVFIADKYWSVVMLYGILGTGALTLNIQWFKKQKQKTSQCTNCKQMNDFIILVVGVNRT